MSPNGLKERPALVLRVTEATRRRGADSLTGTRWWAVLGAALGAACALAGWLVVAAVTLLGWLSDPAGAMTSSLRVATQFWLSAHGASAHLSPTSYWTLWPLTITGLAALLLSGSGTATRRMQLPELHRVSVGSGLRPVLQAAAAVGVGYLLAGLVLAISVGAPGQYGRTILGTLLIGTGAALLGCVRGEHLLTLLPPSLRAVPRAVALGLGLLLVSSALLLVIGLIRHWTMAATLMDASAGGVFAGIILVLAQLAYLPNLVLWAMSYLLGAGFSVGTGSVVSPTVTDLGLLPALPITAALPTEQINDDRALLWLLVPAVAGVIAAWWALRPLGAEDRRPGGRLHGVDQHALVGGLVGLLTGLSTLPLAALSRGSLGTGRLVGLGPRLLDLAVMAPTVLGLSGLVTGLVFGLLRLRRTLAAERADHDAAERADHEATIALDRGMDLDETVVLTDSEPTDSEPTVALPRRPRRRPR